MRPMTTPVVPARAVLAEAVETNARRGHENDGFLSERNGFLPLEPPAARLPSSHAAWDRTAGELPELFRVLRVREALAAMPVLSAAAGHLEVSSLLRASTILSIFAHAYHHVDADHPEPLPASIAAPWQQVSARLGQPGPHLSFNDMNTYNWRRKAPSGPVVVENLELLVPIVGNEDERRFQMTPVELTARFAPIVGAVVRAQEACVAGETAALKDELALIADTLYALTFEVFPKVDPNPYSPSHVNPVVWGKTVAPLATPFQDDPPPGPSGTAIPAFQLMDGFLGRHRYDSTVGSETARARGWFPVHWRRFLDAVEQISVADHVARNDDRELQGLFHEVLAAYHGADGLLGRHRLKTFGYLDLSFKAGRSATLGGFAGSFESRPWDQMDGELGQAMEERTVEAVRFGHLARLTQVERLRDGGGPPVSQVTLSVAGSGLRHRPGDRCAVLPESDPQLVERTVRALRARGDEPITLDRRWRSAIGQRDGYERAQRLPLRLLLTFGRIRPVDRGVAKALFAMSRDETLRAIIEARAEDQWELWDLLELLARSGFRPARLWKGQPGDWQHLCRIVPPEQPRLFSISSAMTDPQGCSADDLTLTVGGLRYETQETEVSPPAVRYGTGSNFLARSAPAGDQRPITVEVVPSARLHLPEDDDRPVVMIAGGTGVSPFLGMIEARMRTPAAGRTWLLLGTGTPAEVYGERLLRAAVASGALHVRIAFSRADERWISMAGDGGPQLRAQPACRARLDAVLREPGYAAELRELLWPAVADVPGARVLVCGRAGFAASIESVLHDLLDDGDGVPGGDDDATAAMDATVARAGRGRPRPAGAGTRTSLASLTGQGRYVPEVYTTYRARSSDVGRRIDASEVVEHNDEQHGLWMIIEGRVYDLTRFAQLHPGGDKIIRSYAGMDATAAYRTAQHDVHPEVDALRSLYEIGVVRRLDFGAAWGLAIGPSGLQVVGLKDLYRAWIGCLYATVEMENALANDYGIRAEPVTHDERHGSVTSSLFKSRSLFQTHERFAAEYLPLLAGERVEHLWAVTSGLGDNRTDVRWLRDALAEVRDGPAAQKAADLRTWMAGVYGRAARPTAEADRAALARCERLVVKLEAEDRRLLRHMKQLLRDGVRVIERDAAGTLETGIQELREVACRLPGVLEDYLIRLARTAGDH